MIDVTFYSRDDCRLCEEALVHLESLQQSIPHQLIVINIDGDRDLQRKYGLEIPVVEVGPYHLKAPFTRQDLEITLKAAEKREKDLEIIAQTRFETDAPGSLTITRADRFSYWLAKHYMLVLNLLVVIYLGLPFLAPTLIKSGFTGPATVIYRVYGAVCHQFAFRSWFLFGEQELYPRQAAGVQGLLTYGQATGLDENDILAARQFFGNPQLGYKVALCERDVAIYGGILLFGLVFSLTGRKIKPLPWYIWVVVGLIPITMDGVSQLISQPPLNLLPYRETTPFLRTITGLLFGITTAWFGYPLVEETMKGTRNYIEAKLARVKAVREAG